MEAAAERLAGGCLRQVCESSWPKSEERDSKRDGDFVRKTSPPVKVVGCESGMIYDQSASIRAIPALGDVPVA